MENFETFFQLLQDLASVLYTLKPSQHILTLCFSTLKACEVDSVAATAGEESGKEAGEYEPVLVIFFINSNWTSSTARGSARSFKKPIFFKSTTAGSCESWHG